MYLQNKIIIFLKNANIGKIAIRIKLAIHKTCHKKTNMITLSTKNFQVPNFQLTCSENTEHRIIEIKTKTEIIYFPNTLNMRKNVCQTRICVYVYISKVRNCEFMTNIFMTHLLALKAGSFKNSADFILEKIGNEKFSMILLTLSVNNPP